MKLLRHHCWLAVLACALAWSLSPVLAQEAKEPEKPAEPAATAPAEPAKDAEPAKEGEPAAPAATEAAPAGETPPVPALPKYMNADPKNLSGTDPTGGAAGYWATPSAGPVGDGDPTQQKPEQLYDKIVHNLYSVNMVWTLVAGFLVMFMQAGFAMVEGGLCRAKNASHTFGMNLMVYPLGCLSFWAYGFALGWGNWFNAPVADGWYASLGPGLAVLDSGYSIPGAAEGVTYGLFGTKGFFLHGMDDVSVMALFFFMMVFMDTTATIPTGALAERWAWKSFCLYGCWVALPYCIYANWVWGGGWLAQAGKNWGLGHGAVDFAGSGVVHAMGGVIGLAGAMVIGPRIGKFINGKPQAIPGHDIPLVILGTFILAFGWFGFNPGSTLAGTDLRISVVVVNTMLASCTGALACMCYLMMTGLKPDPSMICNGMLAGLVAITAPCAFVDSWAAALIGAVAGVLVVISVFFWERMGIDDPVGAISVHGVNGVWGLISLGLLANGKYGAPPALPDGKFGAGWNGVAAREKFTIDGMTDGVRGAFYGDMGQLWAQVLDSIVVIVFGFIMAYVWFKVSNLITPLRVSKEVELEGLDGPEMGSLGYPDFAIKGGKLDA